MSFERIPNFTQLRKDKDGYDKRFTIDTEHPLFNDPLVDPRESDFGFTDASSYYSQPNRMTGKVLPGVPDAPLVRLDVAKRLQRAEEYLRTDPEVRDALGAPARLKISDALRPYAVQKFAFEVAWPQIIREQNPELSEEELLAQVPKYCARPADSPTPTPHLTGGAVDVSLVNVETDEHFDRGHVAGKVQGTAFPDFHEGTIQSMAKVISKTPRKSGCCTRTKPDCIRPENLIFFMHVLAGLENRSNEIWHYGKGDPLSEYVAGISNHSYYG
ncbi:MAG: hypothetical protein U0491_00615 [Candidatus Saccharimonadales bacterium]